ncbi:MAG: M15 family metallopeptidase [Nitrospiraceae bacterium]
MRGHRRALRLTAVTVAAALTLLIAGGGCTTWKPTPQESLQRVAGSPNYVDLSSIPSVTIDLKYASSDNFLNTNLYGDFRTALLHRVAAEKLARAARDLERINPGWRLLVFDALRPRSVQRHFWSRVKGTSQEPYVTDPEIGSIHNFGFAVDLSLMDPEGYEVDMGTAFDDFTELSEPERELEFLQAGRLTARQIEHRQVLRKVMTEAGFTQLPNEWWHFDALPADIVRDQYPIVE